MRTDKTMNFGSIDRYYLISGMKKVNRSMYQKMNTTAEAAMRANLTLEIEFYQFVKQRFEVAVKTVLGKRNK